MGGEFAAAEEAHWRGERTHLLLTDLCAFFEQRAALWLSHVSILEKELSKERVLAVEAAVGARGLLQLIESAPDSPLVKNAAVDSRPTHSSTGWRLVSQQFVGFAGPCRIDVPLRGGSVRVRGKVQKRARAGSS